jgi:hypothetical protein
MGLVDYRADGTALPPVACDADLVLGPLPPGAIVTVSETRVDVLLWIRILGFAAALLIAWRLIPFGRSQPGTHARDVR